MKEKIMNAESVKQQILAAKAAKQVTWDQIAAHLGMSPVWTASACFGMNSMKESQASALVEFLELDAAVVPILTRYPTKTWDNAIPQDPLIYRFYEIVGVYGETLKSVIQEKFGDGIMSAIDFTMHVEKIEDPKGDRVLVTMNGKFLPYKSW
jgi:cyanate lyase